MKLGLALSLPMPRTAGIVGGDLNFAAGQYALNSPYYAGFPPGWSYARTGPGTALTNAGTMIDFADNAPRITDRGMLIEAARVNGFLNARAPVTQVISFASTGSKAISIKGSGSVTTTAGTATITGSGAATEATPLIINVTVIGTVTFTVTGSVDWVQVEAGTTPTSLIPTAGVSVTRTLDAVKLTMTPATNWTVAVQTELLQAITDAWIGFQGPTSADRVAIYRTATGTGRIYRSVASTVVTQDFTANAKAGVRTLKAALSWDGTKLSGSIDGETPVDLTGAIPTNLDRMILGMLSDTGATAGSQYVKRALYWPFAKAGAALQAAI